jgi:type IV pilus assembly protein PilW
MKKINLKQQVRMNFEYGFSLVELMVGLVIGLLATLVIMQVFSTFEGQKRTTSGTADAQINGNIALYNVQRELKQAGYSLPIFDKDNTALDCPVATTVNVGTNLIPKNVPLFPFSITDTGGTDEISVRFGSSIGGGIPVRVKSITGKVITVPNALGCTSIDGGGNPNDFILLNAGAKCNVTKVTAVNRVNNADDTITLSDQTGVTQGDKVSCLGGSWNQVVYRINANQLERNNSPIVGEIVDMQAQYGISSTATSNQITAWVDATGVTWGTPSVTDRNRIKALRVAIVARNGLLEATQVTAPCSALNAASPTGLCAWEGSATNPAPALFGNRANPPANWRNYRYRVFETMVPMRNMLWAKN